MTLDRSKLFTFSANLLLLVAYAASADARPHGNRTGPSQSDAVYYHYNPSYNTPLNRDNSCFSSTGLPEMYACSPHNG